MVDRLATPGTGRSGLSAQHPADGQSPSQNHSGLGCSGRGAWGRWEDLNLDLAGERKDNSRGDLLSERVRPRPCHSRSQIPHPRGSPGLLPTEGRPQGWGRGTLPGAGRTWRGQSTGEWPLPCISSVSLATPGHLQPQDEWRPWERPGHPELQLSRCPLTTLPPATPDFHLEGTVGLAWAEGRGAVSCHALCLPAHPSRGARLRGHADTGISGLQAADMQGRGTPTRPWSCLPAGPNSEEQRPTGGGRHGWMGLRELTEPAGPY